MVIFSRSLLPISVLGLATLSPLVDARQSSFNPAVSAPTGTYPYRLIPGDLDGDGSDDVMSANLLDGTVSVLLSSGTAKLGIQMLYGAGSRAIDLTAADFDGDGYLDAAVLDDTTATVEILLGDGTGMLPRLGGFAAVVGTSNAPSCVETGDLNGDGNLDLVVLVTGDIGGASQLFLLENLGGAGAAWLGFGAPLELPLQVSFQYVSGLAAIAIGDVTGDGWDDVVAAQEGSLFLNNGSDIYTFPGDGQGGIESAIPTPVGSGVGPQRISLADADGDGDLDLATANSFTGDVSALRNAGVDANGDWYGFGLFSLLPPFPREFAAANATDVAWLEEDLNGDGISELVTIESTRDSLGILFSDPAGFLYGGHVLVGDNPSDLVLIDGAVVTANSDDGDLSVVAIADLAVAAAASGNVGVGGGGPIDVLEINGSAGGATRTVTVTPGETFTITIEYPSTNSAGYAPFALWGRIGAPAPADFFYVPGIGGLSFAPCPFASGFTLTDNLGTGTCGPAVPSQPLTTGQTWSFSLPGGIAAPLTLTFQGLTYGLGSTIQATNGIVLEIL